MNGASIIEIDRLTVGYRRRRRRYPILQDLSLHLSAGELVCLLGPNGIGKSSLLRTIAALQPPLTGVVRLDGTDIARLPAAMRAKQLGIVLSERISVGALRAREMVALGRYAYTPWDGRLTDDDWRIVDRAIAAVGAEQLADRDCRELSDGERQKLSLARVLAQEPAVILLDEPTAFLDLAARVELMLLLRDLARDQGIAIVASSHDLDLALRHADRLWLIDRERRIATGVPEDLVLDGSIARAFSTPRVSFSGNELGLRGRSNGAVMATITGPAGAVGLATTTLERAGIGIANRQDQATIRLTIAEDGKRWNAQSDDGAVSGSGYAALAAFARQLTASPTDPFTITNPQQARG